MTEQDALHQSVRSPRVGIRPGTPGHGLPCLILWAVLLAGLPSIARAQDSQKVEELAKRGFESVVVVESSDRKGESGGLGTGFVVRSDGVVVTNLHVIEEGRELRVEFRDGTSYEPKAILAVDRRRDLAVIQLEASGLAALKLGDSSELKAGQTIVAVGNPLGFRFSVARGVVSARRELDGRDFIQVAMSVEPGSSGSPVMDLEGRVVGILAVKTGDSLGFAIPVNQLKPLLEDFHPVPMSKWLTIGALDPREWEGVLGGRWRQRAGRLLASRMGDGFGGRMLCLSQHAPEGAFEAAVEVKLADESGAAGLAFHSDGNFNHYGFYPTAGSIRLTRFDGPTVFQWSILQTVASDAYRPGEWNRIRVRVDGSRLTGFVNGVLTIELEDSGLTSGRVGVVKFRQPGAEFRRFRVGEDLAVEPTPEDVATVERLLKSLPEDGRVSPGVVADLAAVGIGTAEAIRGRAAVLQRESARLVALADRVHRRLTLQRLAELVGEADDFDLLHATLLIALLDNNELDVEGYLRRVDRLAADARARLGDDEGEEARLNALVDYFFNELRFHGSHGEYYHRSNSYVSEVLDDREGLPITLSIIFLELARRVGLAVEGLGVPQRFLCAYRLGEEHERIIDVFAGGKTVTRTEASVLSRTSLRDEDFRPMGKRAIVSRVLRNLMNVAERERDLDGMLRYLDGLVIVEVDAVYSRGMRAMLLYREGRFEAAAEDLDWLLQREPAGADLDVLRRMRDAVKERGF